jgi:hypothetical protein
VILLSVGEEQVGQPPECRVCLHESGLNDYHDKCNGSNAMAPYRYALNSGLFASRCCLHKGQLLTVADIKQQRSIFARFS